jgi:hypothetical protein
MCFGTTSSVVLVGLLTTIYENLNVPDADNCCEKDRFDREGRGECGAERPRIAPQPLIKSFASIDIPVITIDVFLVGSFSR